MIVPSISIEDVRDQLRSEDDPAAWKTILEVIGEEFILRYETLAQERESWFLRIGTCSHWWRPHQARWLAAGGFAYAVGYQGSSNGWPGLPEFDWSVILAFDGTEWERVNKFSGRKQIEMRVAVPSRTARHKQASVHTTWSTSHEFTLYGFRNFDGEWACVAASDEKKQGRILNDKKIPRR